MIRIGLNDSEKSSVVERYIRDNGIEKVFVLSTDRFAPGFAQERVTKPEQLDGRCGVYLAWPDHIEYRYYYRILQQADKNTLFVVNECLRGQSRTTLNYNCIRTFLRQVRHQIVFQHFPMVESLNDMMTLVDFDTRSKWWDRKFEISMLSELDFSITPRTVEIVPQFVTVDAKTHASYSKEKAELLASVRSDPEKDPHQIPRNLLLVSGKGKLRHLKSGVAYVGRNNRLKIENFSTYREADESAERTAFELPHSYLDMADFLSVTKQRKLPVVVADTKAEAWYLDRFQQWAGRLNDATLALHG